MNITAGTNVFSLVYVLGPELVVCIRILPMLFFTALGECLCNFVFPFLNLEGCSLSINRKHFGVCV